LSERDDIIKQMAREAGQL